MTALLGRILVALVGPVLNWLYNKIAVGIHDWVAARKAREAIEKKNADAAKLAEDAKTKEERDAATAALRTNF